jgi:hypothetical protein
MAENSAQLIEKKVVHSQLSRTRTRMDTQGLPTCDQKQSSQGKAMPTRDSLSTRFAADWCFVWRENRFRAVLRRHWM